MRQTFPLPRTPIIPKKVSGKEATTFPRTKGMRRMRATKMTVMVMARKRAKMVMVVKVRAKVKLGRRPKVVVVQEVQSGHLPIPRSLPITSLAIHGRLGVSVVENGRSMSLRLR